MSIITSIKQQKKKNRVNVYLDERFGFGIDLDNFVLLNLRVGQELSEEQIIEIVKKSEFQKTLDKLLRFAMMRPRSEKEIRDWFRRKEVPESIHKELLLKLKRFELLDDEKFAKWWVDQRKQFRFKSKKALVYELKSKGVEQEIIERVMSDEDISDESNAMKILEKKSYKWQRLDRQTAKQKMYEYLARLGFDFDVIKLTVAKYMEKA